MNLRQIYRWCAVGVLPSLFLCFGLCKIFAQPAPASVDEGVQVLTRGPVHEAFAEAVTYDPEPGIVVSKTPPEAIEELPPEQRLEGANVAWIPGYWGWDDERKDFLWISGIWRDLPPGRQWVPGYWGKTAQGFQWTSGYWADAQVSEVEYLPEPPASVEAGPTVAASSPDNIWLPGCWVWQGNRYAWRSGFWAAAHADWVWTPAHYVWAPRGYVYVDGYWDYSIGRRGVLFAPVYFRADVYGRRGFSYSPTTVIDLGVFSDHLFLRPRYQHYYFGDYYAANYRGAGFYPWFSINTGRYGYDPIYAHNRWQHRQDREWEQRQQANFQNLRDHEDLRPPHTWAGQGLRNASDATSRVGLPRVAGLLDDLSRNRESQHRFQQMDQAERQRLAQQAREVQRFRQERQMLETNATGPARVKLPGSPIVAKPDASFDKGHAPPKTFIAPKPDAKIAPKPRVTRAPLDQPQTKEQPKAERKTPPPQAERKAPSPQVERKTPPQGKESAGGQPAGSNQERPKDGHQGKSKDNDRK